MRPNLDQVLSATRNILSLVCGFLVGHGYVSADLATAVVGVVMALVPFGWGYYMHTDNEKLKAVEALSDVRTIIVKPTATNGVADAANDMDRPKVVKS